MVCDPEIWKQVFKRAEDFTKERLMKLVGFCTRDDVCREIKAEVVKLAARGIVYDDNAARVAKGQFFYTEPIF